MNGDDGTQQKKRIFMVIHTVIFIVGGEIYKYILNLFPHVIRDPIAVFKMSHVNHDVKYASPPKKECLRFHFANVKLIIKELGLITFARDGNDKFLISGLVIKLIRPFFSVPISRFRSISKKSACRSLIFRGKTRRIELFTVILM